MKSVSLVVMQPGVSSFVANQCSLFDFSTCDFSTKLKNKDKNWLDTEFQSVSNIRLNKRFPFDPALPSAQPSALQ